MTDIPHEVEAFAIGLENLAAWWRANPHVELPTDFGDGRGRLDAKIHVHDSQDLANLSRRLGGNRRKLHHGDDLLSVTRDFGGGVQARVITHRSTTCERVQVGTQTVVKTAVHCELCGEPIEHGKDDEGWWHVDASGGRYELCAHTDFGGADAVGSHAAPPSFVAQTVAEPVFEWQCPDSILDDELAEVQS